jgi:ribonucleoside-diphosphate reductase beta chain
METTDRRALLARVGAADPELAARLILMALPAAAAAIPGTLVYDLEISGLGSRRVSVSGGRARVDLLGGGEGAGVDSTTNGSNGSSPPEPAPGDVDFRMSADPDALVALATGGAGPLGLMLRGVLRVRGKRRRLLRLRHMASDAIDLADVVEAGGSLDVGALFRSLPYAIEPEWTCGHAFVVRYELSGAGGGSWCIEVRDGQPVRVFDAPPEGGDPIATVRLSVSDYARLASGRITPNEAMRDRITRVEGKLHPVTLLGRWIDRGQGSDDTELKREARQRAIQEQRVDMYAAGNGRDGLLDYRQLYALWERQSWKAHELDFSEDREHWLAMPTAGQQSLLWTLGTFYVSEERVTADLAPFLVAAPSGEIEIFLATQLVDEARHAAFFDRFGAEVMALPADDLRGRLREVETSLPSHWRSVFDDGLRDVANRIKARPDDLDLFVEGVATYHMVVEGFLAVTGQTLIRDYMLGHGIFPGFCEGFGMVERDEHRHVAFGMRFLLDAIEDDPRHRATVERVVLDLAPRAAHVFAPPYVEDHSSWVSYGYDSAQIYGLAYRTLKRRMAVLGIEIPSAAELMPGPIAETGAFQAVTAANGVVAGNGAAGSNGLRGSSGAPSNGVASNGAASNGAAPSPTERETARS